MPCGKRRDSMADFGCLFGDCDPLQEFPRQVSGPVTLRATTTLGPLQRELEMDEAQGGFWDSHEHKISGNAACGFFGFRGRFR